MKHLLDNYDNTDIGIKHECVTDKFSCLENWEYRFILRFFYVLQNDWSQRHNLTEYKNPSSLQSTSQIETDLVEIQVSKYRFLDYLLPF